MNKIRVQLLLLMAVLLFASCNQKYNLEKIKPNVAEGVQFMMFEDAVLADFMIKYITGEDGSVEDPSSAMKLSFLKAGAITQQKIYDTYAKEEWDKYYKDDFKRDSYKRGADRFVDDYSKKIVASFEYPILSDGVVLSHDENGNPLVAEYKLLNQEGHVKIQFTETGLYNIIELKYEKELKAWYDFYKKINRLYFR